MELTGTVLVKLSYSIDAKSKTVTLTHPSLSGLLGFEFTTLPLAEVQLQSISEEVVKTPIERVLDDTNEIITLTKEIRGLFGVTVP